MRDEAGILRNKGIRVVDVGPEAGRLEADGFHRASISAGASVVNAVAAWRAIRHAIREEQRRARSAGGNISAIHAHGVRAAALSTIAARGSSVPVISTLHNAPPRSGLGSIVSALLHRIACRGSERILAVSPDLHERATSLRARAVERAVIPGGIGIVEQDNAVDTEPSKDTTAALPLSVLVIARLAPQKGLDDLLDALGTLDCQQPSAPQWIVRIAGDGPLRDHIESRIRDEGLPVQLLGYRRDIPALLSAADLVVQPSVWEGQPVAVQEALRATRAIVATDAGGTRWVTGDAALLVPPSAPDKLAEALEALLCGPAAAQHRRDLERRSATRADELPTLEDLATQLTKVLHLERP